MFYLKLGMSNKTHAVQHIATARLAQVVERPLSVREAAGLIPGRVIPKTVKIVVMAPLLGAQD